MNPLGSIGDAGRRLRSLHPFVSLVTMTEMSRSRALTFFLISLLIHFSVQGPKAFAADEPRPTRIADNEVDDTYDPFADYSEFDQTSEEEADINFFRNGRFFTIGFIGGYRFVTDQMAKLYHSAVSYGLFLSYFFDLRFAMQIHFLTANHDVNYTSPAGTAVVGTSNITQLGLLLKYYINTQNVTRGLAALNPYFVGGFSEYWRTTTISGQEAFGKDSALGVNIGMGVEFPLMRNKMFFGGQVTYDLVTFPDANSQIYLNQGTEATGLYPHGNFVTALGILGVNF
jgi:outer membrane protein W